MIGMRTTGIHAPIVNLDTTTTVRTMPVAIAPIALTASLRRHRGSRSVWWCTTMPVCESVNPVKTPTA